MSQISVLVAFKSPDVKAELIAADIARSVEARIDMNLVESRYVVLNEVDALLESLPVVARCALLLVGPSDETDALAHRWLAQREDLVVMHVNVVGDIVQIGLHDPSLESLLIALRDLVEHVGTKRRERVVNIHLRSVESSSEDITEPSPPSTERPLLEASITWVHALLRDAIGSVSDDNGDVHGFSITRETILQSLEVPAERIRDNQQRELPDAEAALDGALANAEENPEPLAVAMRVFGLTCVEFRMLILTLAPELDFRYQICIGFLLDDLSRRVGTMGLYSSLLGVTARARADLVTGGGLSRWLVFEGYTGRPAAADEPLRLDPFLAQWLLDEHLALGNDPRVRRVLRLVPWPGAGLLEVQEKRAARLIKKLLSHSHPGLILLDRDDPAGWRALLERGAQSYPVSPIRVVATRLAGVDLIEVEECARRVGRMARLTHEPLVIDITKADGSDAEADYLSLFLATLNRASCNAAVVSLDEARPVQLFGETPFELMGEPALSLAARVAAVRAAARGAGVSYISEADAEAIAKRYPLHVDSLEQAMQLAASRPKNYDIDDPALVRFTTALKELASEGISHLVDRIEPAFSLEEVVLPSDRKQQLIEIVDQIRLAPRVLDDWKFRDQLPYGRGVAALFSGPSGTGKTMAAMGITRRLGIQLLRLDLSRVVSKYIGETEKNLDRVFTDAQRSGAAILIDEADALLGKRSEVKDAHDRYANIEVAYLLQRMEAYEGLAILTTNMRKNLDPAFLRRLRFIVDFPRPDVEAREKIWRQCLPYESHELSDADFRQLARRLDLTGGQIRQITLRAAFIAAAADEQILLEHIAQAAGAELTKLGMPPIEIDLTEKRRAA